jgi:phage portal protein BeeE
VRLLSRLAGTKALELDLLGLDHNGWTLDDDFLVPPWSATTVRNEASEDFNFDSMVSAVYKSNGVVFACVLVRMLAFSEARLRYQRMISGRPGDLWGNSTLDLLERPWPQGTTGDLLSRMEQDSSIAGNFYATTVGEGAERRIRRLRPDWVTIVSGVRGDREASPWSVGAEVLGYIYDPPDADPVLLTPERIVHYSPIPDPAAQWRGMSWMTPVIREVAADSGATKHKLKFFENGGTPSYVIKYDPTIDPATFRQYVELFNEQHRGVDNAYKILHLGGGADPVSVGATLQQIDFKATQGAGETRIAAAAGVGAIMAQLSEGLAGSSLNAGNYGAARRRFADMTIRPLWRLAAASLSKLVPVPPDSRLWYDARDVSFLKEDERDAAEIQGRQAETIARLTDAGYVPESVLSAVVNSDFTLLQHGGLYSVQLQAPGANAQGGEP